MDGDPPSPGPAAGAAGPDGDVAVAGARDALLAEEAFDGSGLYRMRQVVAAHAAAAGLSPARAVDALIAVHELAANAVRHGAGRGVLRVRNHDGAVRCQVQDSGKPGFTGIAADQWDYEPGHGLWVARGLADEMSVTSGPDGTSITVTFMLS